MSSSSNLISDPVTVVIAPDSFKGTITADAAARAIAEGWARQRPHDLLVLKPMADGGEGTVAVAAAATGGELHTVRVAGPDGAPVDAQWLRLPDGSGLVELAATSGLTLLHELAPLMAGTLGFGQAIVSALDAGCDRLLLALGGSASTDGGAGMLTALGARLLDAEGQPIPPGAEGLLRLHEVDLSGLRPLPSGGAVVLSDVENPAVGPSGAAAVYGPQKGLASADIDRVDAALARFAGLLGVDPTTPGTGAAGATGLALAAWGATHASGAAAVAEMIGLPAAIEGSALVITGEGRFDAQTGSGKVADLVAQTAAQQGASIALVAGSIDAPADAFADAVDLTVLAGSAREAMRNPEVWLQEAGAGLAAAWTERWRG